MFRCAPHLFHSPVRRVAQRYGCRPSTVAAERRSPRLSRGPARCVPVGQLKYVMPSAAEVLTVGTHDGVVAVSVVGEVDLANVDDIRDRILLEVGDDPGSVVLDLGPTRYLDSSGIRMLFEIDEQFSVRRIPLHLVVPETGFVHRVLDLTGVLRHIECYPSTDIAIAAAASDAR